MIANLKEYDLVITYSWGRNNHGVCGHIFEVIDYYWILKEHFKCCLFFAEEDTYNNIERIIRSKYDFDGEELNRILSDCVFSHKPKIVLANNILFTDGGQHKLKEIMIKADNRFMFSCFPNDIEGYTILEDKRIYNKDNIDYKKKILFDRLKQVCVHEDKTLLYLTKNCRKITREMYHDLSQRDDKFICVVNNMENIYIHDNFEYELAPVDNIFERFHRYVYTPVPRKWDCSPRFLAECKWYGKDVEFYNIDYWDEDLGLKYRVYDIEHDFDSIHLKEDDDLISILKGYMHD